jgi:hypothetical protein
MLLLIDKPLPLKYQQSLGEVNLPARAAHGEALWQK